MASDFLQFTQNGEMVHRHSGYTETSGVLRDIAYDGHTFYVCTSGGDIDIVRVLGQQSEIDSLTGPAAVNEATGIEHYGGRYFGFAYQGTPTTDATIRIIRLLPSSYVFVGNGLGTSPLFWQGMAFNGRDFFTPYDRQALPLIHRVFWWRPQETPHPGVRTVINNTPSWGSSSADSLRGITFNGRDFWVLFKDSTVYYLQLCRNATSGGGLLLIEQIDISSYRSGSALRGLTFDGKYLYVGDQGV